MKKSRLPLVLFAAVSFPLSVLVACGDDTVVLEVTPEAGPNVDGQSSRSTEDTGVGDTGRADTSTTEDDSGSDGGVDAEADDGGDGGADDGGADDGGADADSGIPVGEPDSGTVAVDFKLKIAESICRFTARCCFGDSDLDAGAPVDGGAYQQKKCIDTYVNSGFESSSPGGSVKAEHITYNKTAAEDCIAKLEAASCTSTTAQQVAIRKACYDAIVGTQKPGDPCGDSAECQPGNFCNLSLDAGVGTGGACEPVRGVGASCGDWTSNNGLAQHTCSYRNSGEPARYCDFIDFATSSVRPRDQWTCKEDLPLGEKCANNEWCSSALCTFPGRTCVDTMDPFTPAACSYFATP